VCVAQARTAAGIEHWLMPLPPPPPSPRPSRHTHRT
jgi:hypothetical protein